ncbi:MAG TPA: Uma2 family endonuclease [Blastocatellia bacterium]|nr:Uma2 family endonuclease [Blastocatellia bacterium]
MSLPKSEPPPEPLYTIDEYLARERKSEERHQYLDGLIYLMAGESPAHGDICVNLIAELRTQLRGTPCRVWTKDAKVLSGPTIRSARSMKGLFSYPDLVVVCGEPKFLDEHLDVVLNPQVIIEVLSPSTESFDRSEKFRRYLRYNPTLTDYVMVSQAEPAIDHFRRMSSGEWVYLPIEGLEDSLTLSSIDCVIRLSEIYDRVGFPEEAEEIEAEP